MNRFRPDTPLWPAGHLPRKGGDQPSAPLSPITGVAKWVARLKLPISPLAGEMSGRTEGGVKERGVGGHMHG
jgi:assimilatory nitrate reductase catalytic subunit